MSDLIKFIGILLFAILAIGAVFAISFGWLWLLTIVVQYAALGIFAKSLPFWPTFAGVFVLNAIFGGKAGVAYQSKS